jgi:putative Holliday junction resolvase
MRVLGVDYGRERVGIALGDTETRIATPWRIIHAKTLTDLMAALEDLVVREKIERLIIGVPYPLQDVSRSNAQVEEVRAFISAVRSLGVEVEEEDERLTSQLAAAQMRERGQKGKRDDLAAAAILQGWLDRTSYAVRS